MTKTSKSAKFLKLVGKHKEKKKKEKFLGTLEDYLKIIESNPGVAQLAHKRLYEAIAKEGITKCLLLMFAVINFLAAQN